MVAYENVLWIGGPSGAGKSTVARLLARRFGLRWYSGDTRTWDHRDRAVAAGDPDALRFEALGPHEREKLAGGDKKALNLTPQRREMVLEDLRRLPPAPLVVAETALLEPGMTDARQAVWLDAPPDELVSRIERRGWGERSGDAARRRHLDHQHLTAGAGIRVVDAGSSSVREVVDRVAAILGDRLEQGPVARDAAERGELVREGNLWITHQYRKGLARFGRASDVATVVRAFDCECADPACLALLELSIARAPGTPDDPPLLAPEH